MPKKVICELNVAEPSALQRTAPVCHALERWSSAAAKMTSEMSVFILWRAGDLLRFQKRLHRAHEHRLDLGRDTR